jgi:two-component system, NarL family, sensor histidine kinase UhpB
MINLPRLWHDRSARTRVLVAVAGINLLAALLAAGISIFNARTATRVEMEASLEIAQRFVEATIKDLVVENQLNQLNEKLPLQLKHLRHVRIMLMDSFGNLTVLSPQPDSAIGAPSWFTALVAPKLADRSVRVVSAGHAQPVVIAGEPADEIAEAWQSFYVQTIVWLALNGLVLIMLFVVLGRILRPLASVAHGMLNLKEGDYSTRLTQPRLKELAVITNRFNTLADALAAAQEENRRVYARLISVQEQERREIASELHDEAGPCLFGITANASSIRSIAAQFKNRASSEISTRVDGIMSIAERLKTINRALLKKLKPGAFGLVTISELVNELVGEFQRRHPGIRIHASIGKLGKSYGEVIDLTLYRCIQEGTANAIRHGQATNLSIDLAERDITEGNGARHRRSAVGLILQDDGKGFAPSTPKGFGLTTMTERVRSLGGSCTIESAPLKGTTIRVEIPVRRGTMKRGRRVEPVGAPS